MDHATALGERLRERVYVDVVPDLATAVAQQLKATTEAELREAYHITLVVLFRLLFVAYAEDRGLLPYRTNEAYTHVSLKGRARLASISWADHRSPYDLRSREVHLQRVHSCPNHCTPFLVSSRS